MKNLGKMSLNIEAYLKTNQSYVRGKLAARFKNSWKITLKPFRFFSSFIDGMSTLYTNPFERNVSQDFPEDLQKSMNTLFVDLEKYHNISAESLAYIKEENEFTALDPSEYVLYPKETNYSIVFAKKDELVYKYEVGKPITYKETTLKQCQKYDKTKESEWLVVDSAESLKTLPFVVVRHPRLAEPQENELVDIEADRMVDMSWAYHNIAPKMLTQPVIKTGEPASEVSEKLKSFGSTSEHVTLGMQDEINVINMGDLKNLLDLQQAWNFAIAELALAHGVDKNKVVSNTEPISGEAKKVDYEYINQARKSRSPIFVKAEQDFITKYNEMFGTTHVITRTYFPPLIFGSEQENTQSTEENTQNN